MINCLLKENVWDTIRVWRWGGRCTIVLSEDDDNEDDDDQGGKKGGKKGEDYKEADYKHVSEYEILPTEEKTNSGAQNDGVGVMSRRIFEVFGLWREDGGRGRGQRQMENV